MPASPAQIAASRANGLKSKGPTTAQGKAISRRNALKHGMAAEVIQPEEDAAEVERRSSAMLGEMRPASEITRTRSAIFSSVGVVAPPACAIVSSTTVPWMSFAPKCSATWASGVEIMAFIDRKRGLKLVETLATHRSNWRLRRFKAGDPDVPAVVKAMGFPRYGVFVISSSDPSRPVKDLSNMDEVVAAVNREANRSDEGLAIVIADMRANRNPTRMRVLRALSWKLAKRLQRLCPKCHTPGFGPIGVRRGLPCECCGEPTHWIDFEIDGCSVCGHAEVRPRKDGRKTAAKLSCASCHPKHARP